MASTSKAVADHAEAVALSNAPIRLRDGPLVPWFVCEWLMVAAGRGLTVRVKSGGLLHASPRDLVRPEDVTFMRHHRDALIACVNYLEQLDQVPPC
jgi:hypothetical protein